MRAGFEDDQYDLAKIIAAALYLGMFINILIPAGLLLICYYLNTEGSIDNSVGDLANGLFYVLGGLSVIQAVGAMYWRNRALAQPMIRRRETFEQDLRESMLARLKPVFLLIMSIAVYGVAYFLLTGRFNEGLFLAVLSFLVFQVVRPRYGSLRKLIAQQEKLVEQGQFRQD